MDAAGAQAKISLKNILYATDFSPAAQSAFPYALGLARRYEAKVHALHVRPKYALADGPEAISRIVDAAEEQAKYEVQQLNEMLASVPHDVSIREGDLWPAIADVILKQDVDLIVIGTRGRTGVERVLLGSAAEEIMRRASWPVLTVGPHTSKDAERRLEMKEILYATDFSPESHRALPYALSMAKEHHARLTMLHVIENEKAGDLVNSETHLNSMTHQLHEMVPPDAASWCEPNFMIVRGHAAERILETAAALSADLIVLGVRDAAGHIGATTHLFRPTAHRIVIHAECPVLTVRG